MRWLSLTEANAVMDLSDKVFNKLVMQVSHITLGPVEFCTFEHMHVCDPRLVFIKQADIKPNNVGTVLGWNRSLPCR